MATNVTVPIKISSANACLASHHATRRPTSPVQAWALGNLAFSVALLVGFCLLAPRNALVPRRIGGPRPGLAARSKSIRGHCYTYHTITGYNILARHRKPVPHALIGLVVVGGQHRRSEPRFSLLLWPTLQALQLTFVWSLKPMEQAGARPRRFELLRVFGACRDRSGCSRRAKRWSWPVKKTSQSRRKTPALFKYETIENLFFL